jgi:hypothetical protein
MSRTVMAALAAAAVVAAPAYAKTSFKTAWKSPDATQITLGPDDTVLAMVITTRDDSRNGAEAALAQELEKRGVEAVPAYTVIPKSLIQDAERARPYVEKAGCKYAVIMRVVGQDKDIKGSGPQYTSVYTGPYYGGLYGGYWGFGWGVAYNAGNMEIDTKVSVETLFYDLRTNKLLWAGMSETVNPSTALKFIKDLVNKVGKEMKKQGLVRR